MRRWYVVTPEYGVVIPVLDYGQGPLEYGCDVIEVEADTRRDAIALGVREMLRGGKGGHGRGERYEWCREQRDSGLSPYAGVKAEPAPSQALLDHYGTCGLCGEGELCDVANFLSESSQAGDAVDPHVTK